MASFYLPLCVMVVVYAKILRVVTDKKKDMKWKKKSYQMAAYTPRANREGSIVSSSGRDQWSQGQAVTAGPQDTIVCSRNKGASAPMIKLTPAQSHPTALDMASERHLSKSRSSVSEENKHGRAAPGSSRKESFFQCIAEQITKRKKSKISVITSLEIVFSSGQYIVFHGI